MLLLHMRTLEMVVDGFLVTESTSCFQTAKEKPAVLTDALAAHSFPASLAAMTAVKVLTRQDGLAAGCKDMVAPATNGDGSSGGSGGSGSSGSSGSSGGAHLYSGRCFQSVQRLALLELLEARAAPDDLAFVADVDEIVSPSLVQLLQSCAPFPPYALWPTEDAFTGYLHIAARQLMYGAHCDYGDTWKDGPRLYLAGWVRRFRVDPAAQAAQAANVKARGRRAMLGKELPWSSRALVARDFDALRPMGSGKDGAIVAQGGGWHLTSWGSATEVVRKLTTFGAAAKFGSHAEALDTGRLESCRRDCIGLLLNRNASTLIPEPTPCDVHTPAATRLKRRATPRSLKRYSVRSVLADTRPLSAAVLRHTFKRGELPPYLIDHPEDFPASWFASLRTAVPGWSTGPEPIVGVPLTLWRCAASSSAASSSSPTTTTSTTTTSTTTTSSSTSSSPTSSAFKPATDPSPGTLGAAANLPALLLYLLGELGPTMAQRMFEFVTHDSDVGDVYVVADATAPPPELSGALARRQCAYERDLAWAEIAPFAAGSHYSGRWCMQKLELLTHLPSHVRTAVLLDADAFVLPEGMRLLRDQLGMLGPDQFVAAPRTDARVERRLSNGTSRLVVPHRSEGINSGLLAIHLPRMRGAPNRRALTSHRPRGVCGGHTPCVVLSPVPPPCSVPYAHLEPLPLPPLTFLSRAPPLPRAAASFRPELLPGPSVVAMHPRRLAKRIQWNRRRPGGVERSARRPSERMAAAPMPHASEH